jgi:hypothetical protein
VISQAQEDAAGDAISFRLTTLSARLETLIATGTGVTPIPDTGQVDRLAKAVTKLAAYNAAAGAWSSILCFGLATRSRLCRLAVGV